ncbi:hypothetical protein NQ314_000102 [Rhamnusium bicolor]|uniref:PiggyBac transposable element-derived protein domain-containing protein n=1 Tax=Rhamnusium bicolor TaxID=1586634 RepID=A0AAV8ZY59_9CUCU|nr:hypothetical protein NQ314_000102 [Rhamnusium bicolor]
MPSEFLPNKSRQVEFSLFGFQYEITLVLYVPKENKAVILLCTIDDKGEIDGAINKPNIILDYNNTKGGVDTVDQICASYSTQRITRRWPLAVFFRILDIAGINSQIIFNNTQLLEKTPRRRKYLSELSVSLIEGHMKERAKINTLPKDIREFLSQWRVLKEEHNAENQNRNACSGFETR